MVGREITDLFPRRPSSAGDATPPSRRPDSALPIWGGAPSPSAPSPPPRQKIPRPSSRTSRSTSAPAKSSASAA
jgi:hypothetical protein